ncbi:uncharacterized protein CEXT_417141 [Caerostris extrusa]|uniref:RNase H type-1 domain-containing protein n=1 Tax=Caerostris extrusa TaxID=172846 RepID=A0AAV4U3B6_CAEEX|nr:uncharacterized protein CEXT_417141 [Caerostris extrusa]
MEVSDNISNSDHNLLLISWSMDQPPPPKRIHVNNSQTNWLSVKSAIFNIIRAHSSSGFSDVNGLISTIQTEITARLCTTSKNKRSPKRVNGAVWWTQELRAKRSKTRALRRLYQKEKEPTLRTTKLAAFKRCQAEYKKMIINTKTNKFKSFINSVTTSSFFGKNFKILTHKKSRQSSLNCILRDDGSTTSSLQDTYSEILSFHFPCSASVDSLPSSFSSPQDLVPITTMELEAVIEGIEPKKASDVESKPTFDPPWNRFKITWNVFNNDVRGFAIFTDGSKLNNNTGCALVVFIDGHEAECILCKLNPEASVFMAEMKAIEMAVNLIVSRGITDATIILDSRSALLALGNPLNNSPYVSKVKDLIRNYAHYIKFMWTRVHVGTAGNEAADAYAKMSTDKNTIDCHFALAISLLKHLLLKDILQQWQVYWNSSLKGRAVFELCPVVSLKRLHGNFYLNQLITGHGALAKYQKKFFHKDEVCSCGKAVEDRTHLILHCERWQNFRKKHFPKNFLQCSLLQLFAIKTLGQDWKPL